MRAVILAGGRGGRLTAPGGPPKPLVELAGQPLLGRVMAQLLEQGVEEFVVALGHRHAEVTRSRIWLDFPAAVLFTGQDVETGYRLRHVLEGIRRSEEPFLLTYCDVVHDIDVRSLWAAHVCAAASQQPPPLVTMTTVSRAFPWGMVTPVSGRYAEKPAIQVNAGLYVVDPSIRSWLPDDPELSWERHVLPQLDFQERLDTHEHRGSWWSVNTTEELRQAEAGLQAMEPIA